jgi:hypothetical protein
MWTRLCTTDDVAIVISLAMAFGMVIGGMATLCVAIIDGPESAKVRSDVPVERLRESRLADDLTVEHE